MNYRFSGGTPEAYIEGQFHQCRSDGEPGSAMGSVDSNLAVVFNPPASNDNNEVELVNPTTGSQVGKIKL